ncbi:hypothetical protein F2Q68_00032270 [Brassica cretica]|uniref:Uncharacterized protein n=1 Tax=Brassica cretica TaxID=69181 RepID=A0A8S9GC33_BRACR|nr:hypothetical protein F2Q68_00032270 [Brassica cretica]
MDMKRNHKASGNLIIIFQHYSIVLVFRTVFFFLLQRFRFEIDMLEGSWYKKIVGALKTIPRFASFLYIRFGLVIFYLFLSSMSGVSFTIDAPSQMVYMCGNIEEGLLMKMLTKTGIQILGVDYGNLKPPPKKVEAQISDGTETQPKKDTAPPPPPEIVVSTSTKHQAKNKKPRGFKKILFCLVVFYLFLSSMSGVSFTIDAPRQMVYMCGNIEEGLLMKMFTKTAIQILGVDYGNLKPPPKKVEAQISDGTETQPKKDTAPPPEIVVSTSTKHQAKNKKPRGFKKNLLSMSHVVMRT